ncbi:MAG: polyamine aminopropyltransferase [Desulfobacterales bacterium]|jgi:spermidine synthase
MREFVETLYDSYGQLFRIDEMLFENRTAHQHLAIFHNAAFGRVLVLDGIVQTTERDEFIYHEMMAHVPILAHGEARHVLIVGGGDGAMLREVVRHRQVEQITQVEIDRQVIDLCRQYLPLHSNGAFDDSRVDVLIDDGLHFMQTTERRFDVVIIDSTDPIGPGEALFSAEFYTACKQRLNPGGILVTQNGVAFMQPAELAASAGRLAKIYADWHFYGAAIPTYVGGIMAFGWASDDGELRHHGRAIIEQRYAASGIQTRFYNPEIHRAAFALPQHVLRIIGKPHNEYRS